MTPTAVLFTALVVCAGVIIVGLWVVVDNLVGISEHLTDMSRSIECIKHNVTKATEAYTTQIPTFMIKEESKNV